MKTITVVITSSIGFIASTKPLLAAPSIKVCWEAESATQIQSPLRRVFASFDRESSANGFLQMPWSENHLSGSATYRFRIIAPGIYYVYIRMKFINSFSNLLYCSVNGSRLYPVGESGSFNFWHWEGGRQRVRCRVGINTLVLKNIDMGMKIDQILLASHPNFFHLANTSQHNNQIKGNTSTSICYFLLKLPTRSPNGPAKLPPNSRLNPAPPSDAIAPSRAEL